jgi:hypothetical protein
MQESIYFSGFDGLINHVQTHKPEWELRPLMRNTALYQLEVLIGGKRKIIFRDSLLLLPGSLRSLGASLVPELGGKGACVDHSTVGLHNLVERRVELQNYLRQEILLLGGIMVKAQARSVGLNTRFTSQLEGHYPL